MKDKGKQLSVLKKVLVRIRKYWPGLILSTLLATLYVVMTLYIPILVGDAIDCIVDAGKVDFLQMGIHLRNVAICVITAALAQWVMSLINNRMTYHVTRDIRNEAFRHIQVLPLSYLDKHSQGDVVSRVIADVDTFADGLLMGFTQLFTGVMTILGTLLFMLRIHWGIALVVVCVLRLCGRIALTNSVWFYLSMLFLVLGAMLFLAGFLGELICRNSSTRNTYLIEKELV